MYIYSEKGLINDPYRANNRISSAYYKMLVDQKVNFILGNYPSVEIFNDDFWYKLKDIATSAKTKGVQWVQVYILDGEFMMDTIPTEQLMPVYENGELDKMWRFYSIGDDEYTKLYTKDEEITYLKEEEIERRGHFVERVKAGANETVNSKSWGVVPFIPLWNNQSGVYDLEPIKNHIDSYDIVLSDFANNLEDFQDVTWILKGYQGESVSDFINDVKLYKSLVVGEDGDARTETIDIPYEARSRALEILEKLIYKFGFGLNMDALSGGSLTNVNIQAQFSNLEMACNAFAQEVTKFIDRYIELYNIYAKMTNKQMIEPQEIVYNKTMMVNKEEEARAKAIELEANAKQMGAVSTLTRLENHPWTEEDPEQEIKRLEEEDKITIVNELGV